MNFVHVFLLKRASTVLKLRVQYGQNCALLDQSECRYSVCKR